MVCDTAANGGVKMPALKTVPCWKCNGTGIEKVEEGARRATYTTRKECWHCEGTGERYHRPDGIEEQR